MHWGLRAPSLRKTPQFTNTHAGQLGARRSASPLLASSLPGGILFVAVAENQPLPMTEQNRLSEHQVQAEWTERILEFIGKESGRDVPNETEFTALSLELFRFQLDFNPAYAAFCRARLNNPFRVQDWKDIPPIPTSAFKEFELSCLPARERSRVFHSSGTTAHRPSRHFHSKRSLRVYERSLLSWFGRHLLPGMAFRVDGSDSTDEHGSMRLMALVPSSQEAPHSSLVHMFENVSQSFAFASRDFLAHVDGAGDWQVDCIRAVEILEQCEQQGNPLLLLGTAFSFVHLLDHLARLDRKFELPPGSRVMETGGYKGRSRVLQKSALHELMASRFGLSESNIVSEYGMSELSSQAYDRRIMNSPSSSAPGPATLGRPEREVDLRPRPFRFPPWARVRIISPETSLEVEVGKVGLIVVHDLANTFSVAAIQTEDLAVRRSDGFELVGRAEQVEPRGCSLMLS